MLLKVLVILLVIVSFTAAAAAALLFYLFGVFPRLKLKTLPPGAGAVGPGFEVREAGGLPYLMVNDLPYPTDFEKTDHPLLSLNGLWKFRYDRDDAGEAEEWFKEQNPGRRWKDMAVPGTFNPSIARNPGYQGAAWYWTRFRFTKKADPRNFIRLCFQGVLLRCTVWLNGRLIGSREGGYTPFFFDISEALRPGEDNILTVKIDNRLTADSLPPTASDIHRPGWHTYGGIYRPVYIETVPRRYIFKAVARVDRDGESVSLRLSVLTHSTGALEPYRLRAALYDPRGKLVGRAAVKSFTPQNPVEPHTLDMPVRDPQWWSPGSPALYRVALTLASRNTSQTVQFHTGLRAIEVRNDGLYLNGRRTFLNGICKHEDHPELGATQKPSLISRDLGLIRKMKANYIRMAHYPHCVEELYEARNMGFLLSGEIPYYQVGTGFTSWFEEKQSIRDFPVKTFGMRHLHNLTSLLNAQRELIEMVERDINNPAIIFWSVGNESFSLFDQAGRVYGWLRDVVRRFDTTRPVTFAELTYNIPLMDRFRSSAKYMDFISINMYYGWYYGHVREAGPHLDALHRRYPGLPIVISEFGADAAPKRKDSDGIWDGDKIQKERTYSEEYQARLLKSYVQAARSRPYVAGVSPWVFADFFCPEFPNNPVPFFNLKGVFTSTRKPKAAYYVLQKLYGSGKK